MAYTTVNDVEVRGNRTFTAGESAQVAAWVDDLEADILERIPTLEALILAGRPTVATIKRVVAGAIIRKLDNPKGLKSRTVAIDDYSTTEVADSSNSAGWLGLTDDEWNLLLPGSSGEAFTIRMAYS
jgi:hypothetical protein